MKEKVKEIISYAILVIFFAILLSSWLFSEPNGHYEQYTSKADKADSETHYIYVEEECK